MPRSFSTVTIADAQKTQTYPVDSSIIALPKPLRSNAGAVTASSDAMTDFSPSNLCCPEPADDVASWDSGASTPDPPSDHGDDRPISPFLDSELHHMPGPDYLRRFHDRSLDVTTRQDAVSWILKVHAHFGFHPVTAFLAVNYFDRFLSAHSLPHGSAWPFQLLSVACLSIAAKMEEKYPPLLLDLQLFEPRFVFESRTVSRMELLVMANLHWRMRAVTPFDYVDHFARRLGCAPARIASRASDLILSTHRVIDFLGYRPSTVAAAAVLCAAGEMADSSADSLGFYEPLSKEMVSRCQQLMEEYLIDTCPSAEGKAISEPVPAPQSPAGVLDAAACGSCDTQKSSAAAATTSANFDSDPAPSCAEPCLKRRKLRCTATVEMDGQEEQ